jgi:hypothetical protein
MLATSVALRGPLAKCFMRDPRDRSASILRDRVEDFIAHRAHPEELYELILECINDATVEGLACVRRLYEDMYGGITFNFELKAPAAACLVFWGEAGLQALVDGAKSSATSQNVSLCVQVLATVASGRAIPFISFLSDARIAEKIESEHAKLKGIDEIARVLLTQFVLSLESVMKLPPSEVAFRSTPRKWRRPKSCLLRCRLDG